MLLAYLILFSWLWDYLYFIFLSSLNWKYESVACCLGLDHETMVCAVSLIRVSCACKLVFYVCMRQAHIVKFPLWKCHVKAFVMWYLHWPFQQNDSNTSRFGEPCLVLSLTLLLWHLLHNAEPKVATLNTHSIMYANYTGLLSKWW